MDALTLAYIAIGAARAMDELSGELREMLTDYHGGELGVIEAAIEHASMLDGMWNEDLDSGSVWAYDVAEPFGQQWVQSELLRIDSPELMRSGDTSAERLAERILRDTRSN